MNLAQIIEKVNKFKPSALDEEEIAAIVDELESDIVLNVYNETVHDRLTMDDVGKELKAPTQFSKIYYEYVESQIDKINGQIDMYALSSDQFNSTYSDLAAYVTRNNLRANPKSNRFANYF